VRAYGLDGRVAIVTGASAGLGTEFAHGLAEAGARLIVAARRADLIGEVARDIERTHGTDAVGVQADVSDEQSVIALVEATLNAFGTVDILVNNAGATLMRPLLEHTLADWRSVIDVNLTGTFLVSREVARVMVPKRSGSIVNVSSVFGQGATREYPVVSYYASKGGVEGLTKALAVELGQHNVRVNAIAPGFFPSPMSTDMFADSELGERLRREVLGPRTALPTLPRGADLRGAVRFLAGDESAFVTGHTLVVDGGWRAF
jgi:NAD(P)-dependent dehydrogenase (short-subunit alcohol dehydrogenase family)